MLFCMDFQKFVYYNKFVYDIKAKTRFDIYKCEWDDICNYFNNNNTREIELFQSDVLRKIVQNDDSMNNYSTYQLINSWSGYTNFKSLTIILQDNSLEHVKVETVMKSIKQTIIDRISKIFVKKVRCVNGRVIHY